MSQYSESPRVSENSATAGNGSANQTNAARTSVGAAGGGDGSQQPGHKRVYQACIPCRRRKVRCDLGSVDNPHDPPCVRCRRESKECFFSATRRKRKGEEGYDESGTGAGEDEYVIRNGRKRLRSEISGNSPPPPGSIDRRLYNDVPLTPGGSMGRSQPLRRPGEGRGSRGGVEFAEEANVPLENLEARTVMRRELYGPHDALDLLYKAATDSPHGDAANPTSASQANGIHGRSQSHSSRRPDQVLSGVLSGVPTALPVGSADGQPIDPELTKKEETGDPGYTSALRAWARFRFVRAGWFTAQEAIEYINYYYTYLSPLTPISPPTFHNPAAHVTLLSEEPILAVTLLTIASRYRTIPGPGGHCRSHAIHEQLWTYLRGMIERVIWGQESFGGGFCGSGLDESESSSTAPWRGLRRGSLRTLGTIESLLILTEWHPRALHFPPDAMDELLLPSMDPRDNPANGDPDQRPPGVNGRRIEGWLEPAWRSDRMCWMLLSAGMALAYELGVFDDIDELLATGYIFRPEYEDETYRLRAYRIKRLLLIYATQLAGRLGWTNMVPESLRVSDPAFSRRRPTAPDGTTPGTNISSLSNNFNYIPDLELDDQIIHCWAGISNAMHLGNVKIFRSRRHTTEIIQSGKYVEILKDFQPLLADWFKEFELFKLPTFIRHILTIEYEYVRIYINSLSLQAVVERCTSNAGNSIIGNITAGSAGPLLSPQTQNYYGKLPLGQLGGFSAKDQEYVKTVVDACRSLLRTVVDGLLPGDFLKHCPVRTYFRIISGAMFLLKTFALGAPKSDVETSITLMDRTVDALRNCVVDDVHLGIRFADLLESLMSRLRNRFIHAPPPLASGDRSPHTGPAEPLLPGQTLQHAGGPEGLWAKTPGPERTATPVNVSATPFDLSTGNFPFPTGSASMFGPSTPAAANAAAAVDAATALPENMFGDASDWNNNEMWYLPTGAAFFQNMGGDASVAMTAEGVNIAGMDLLDYMTMDQPHLSLEGSGF
ncbi:uncharacterized protein E0L32_009365 [Thyridium curvatum]|uniref:Zn(2)-C6 fungal-type domain-containing protein n=1 Tax=Thyridium curvatum TaxID=1093900 RepID=A0A507APZ9_9PEZI|nr:uncharacterized protein E0L32_009365 [Thyridium curvatum]TPX09477.1 hypothetical protein E0L32_009365 [Thyridium curvatum]